MKQRIRNGNIETTNNKASKTHHLFFNKHAIISDLPFRRKKKLSKNWYKLEIKRKSSCEPSKRKNGWKLQVIRGKITNITITSPFTLGFRVFFSLEAAGCFNLNGTWAPKLSIKCQIGPIFWDQCLLQVKFRNCFLILSEVWVSSYIKWPLFLVGVDSKNIRWLRAQVGSSKGVGCLGWSHSSWPHEFDPSGKSWKQNPWGPCSQGSGGCG